MRVIFETPRLQIREFRPEDSELVYRYSNEQCTKDELPDEVFESLDETTSQIARFIRLYSEKAYPLVYAIVLKKKDILIGHISYSPIGEGMIEIGYAIAEAYQHKGYASELVQPMSDWGKRNLHLSEVYGIAKKSNTASWRVLEKAGFAFIGESEENCFMDRHVIRKYRY